MDLLINQQVEPRQSGIRRFFFISLMASLSISALAAIFIFLIGSFGEMEIRILTTVLVIGGYSLSGLCSSVLYDKGEHRWFAVLGVIVAFVGFLVTVAGIWNITELLRLGGDWKMLVILFILSFSAAHLSLLLLAKSENTFVNSVLFATIFCIAIVAALLISIIIGGFSRSFGGVSGLQYRLLGVFAVLDVLGTIITPILRRVRS